MEHRLYDYFIMLLEAILDATSITWILAKLVIKTLKLFKFVFFYLFTFLDMKLWKPTLSIHGIFIYVDEESDKDRIICLKYPITLNNTIITRNGVGKKHNAFFNVQIMGWSVIVPAAHRWHW